MLSSLIQLTVFAQILDQVRHVPNIGKASYLEDFDVLRSLGHKIVEINLENSHVVF